MNKLNIKTGNVLEDIKQYKDNFFNTIFCDPPYQLGTEWIIDSNRESNTFGRPIVKGKAKDFMSKWDGLNHDDLDLFFKESHRIIKYGGYLLVFGIDRQLLPLEYYARLNGFEQCQSLYWYFISNFPKSADLSKNIDKRLGNKREIVGEKEHSKGLKEAIKNKVGFLGDDANKNNEKMMGYGTETISKSNSELGKLYEGYKYGIAPLKQTNETILVFRKKTKYGSILNDAVNGDEDCSICAFNIENSRVGTKTGDKWYNSNYAHKATNYNSSGYKIDYKRENMSNDNGRYPPQTFLSKDTAEIIDNQSGVRTSGATKKEYTRNGTNPNDTYGKFNKTSMKNRESQEFGASKICHICNFEKDDFDIYNYSSKVSEFERNFGLNEFEDKKGGFYNCNSSDLENFGGMSLGASSLKGEYKNPLPKKNNHPTLKPINLIKQIATYFKLPIDQKVYIPFCGVFSEIIGFHQAGYKEENIWGCEMSEEYVSIGNARFKSWKENKDRSRTEEQIKRVNNDNKDKVNKKLGDYLK